MTITVGKINKEALSITGIGYNPKAPSVGITSLDISIADFVKLFNREQSKILKNLPDGFLNEKQKGMKQKVIEHDNNIENKMNKIQSQIKNLQQDLADTKKEYYSSIQSEYDEYER